MRIWELPVDKKRQHATQALSETDENLKHVVSTACRPRVFQIALFKGFPNIPHIPPLRDTHRAQIRQKTHRVGAIPTDPERYLFRFLTQGTVQYNNQSLHLVCTALAFQHDSM